VPLLPQPNVHIRAARREDIPAIESCNLKTLPENYPNSFYHNHLLQWPYLALVAEKIPVSVADLDDEKKIVGYVLGRVETPQGLYDPSS
jgi:ribosomal-protein-alanine N-acetyltransferase